MKEIIMMMLGILAISMFLIGCSQENIEVVDTDGNLVGEAFKYSGKYRVQLKQPMVQKQTCDDLNCKLNTQEVYLYGENDLFSGLSWSTLSTGAGMIKNSGKSGNQLCVDAGFDGCIAINRINERTFFSTSDGTCSGVNFFDSYVRPTNCGEPLQIVKGNCATGTYLMNDGIQRDIKDYHKDDSVICYTLS